MRSQYSADFLAERPLLFLLRVFDLKQKTWKLPQACQQTWKYTRLLAEFIHAAHPDRFTYFYRFLCVSVSSCTMTETSTRIRACLQTNASLLTLTVFSVIQVVWFSLVIRTELCAFWIQRLTSTSWCGNQCWPLLGLCMSRNFSSPSSPGLFTTQVRVRSTRGGFFDGFLGKFWTPSSSFQGSEGHRGHVTLFASHIERYF